MISREKFDQIGIDSSSEQTPIDILGSNAMSTREIMIALNNSLPDGYKKITFSCAKQKMRRLEQKGKVSRKKVDALIYWISNE